MNLKKLTQLEQEAMYPSSVSLAQAEDGTCVPPHEQDDPYMSGHPDTPTYNSIAAALAASPGTLTSNIAYPTTGAPSTRSSVYAPLYTHTGVQTNYGGSMIIEGAEPTVAKEGDGLVVTMDGGRELVFQRAGGPVNINGSERKFRLTRKQAQDLAIKLVRLAAEEQ